MTRKSNRWVNDKKVERQLWLDRMDAYPKRKTGPKEIQLLNHVWYWINEYRFTYGIDGQLPRDVPAWFKIQYFLEQLVDYRIKQDRRKRK